MHEAKKMANCAIIRAQMNTIFKLTASRNMLSQLKRMEGFYWYKLQSNEKRKPDEKSEFLWCYIERV